MEVDKSFTPIARTVEKAVGSPYGTLSAVAVIVAWIITGPIFRFSDTWQLVINTGTTIITFLMVFLIQHTQTRDTEAIHIKLNELLRATTAARTELAIAEELDQEALDDLKDELHQTARDANNRRGDK
jgi:low affinity Fe/Cu permease